MEDVGLNQPSKDRAASYPALLTEPPAICLDSAYRGVFALKLCSLYNLAVPVSNSLAPARQHLEMLDLFRILTIEIFALDMLLGLRVGRAAALAATSPATTTATLNCHVV